MLICYKLPFFYLKDNNYMNLTTVNVFVSKVGSHKHSTIKANPMLPRTTSYFQENKAKW